MDAVLKFAAQERGSARTLVLVRGGRAAAGAVNQTPPSRPAGPGGLVNRTMGQPSSAANGESSKPAPAGGGVRTLTVRAGQKLFGPGAGDGVVYLVRTGCVALFKTLPGRRSIRMGLVGPDGVFMQESPRDGVAVSGVTAEVLADATIVAIAVDAMPRLMAASPDLAAAVVAGFARRLTGIQEMVEQLLSRDITLRLAAVLIELADHFGEPTDDDFTAIAIPMPHKLLARLIGANRVTVTRVITDFRAAGLADSKGRNQLSVDPVKLRAYIQRTSR